ncbi:MAG: hypothetical protein QNL04_14615 [SAR324 cluster bacterium]|nr:hypothetical protein [SAR324 cluster bacterium]
MKPETFDAYWEGTLKVILPQLKALHPNVELAPAAKDLVLSNYNAAKGVQKAINGKDHEKLFDRHKIASLITHAIIKVQPLIISVATQSKSNSTTLEIKNEIFAYNISLNILWSMFIDKLGRDAETSHLVPLMRTGKIQIPDCNHGNFKKNLITSFYHIRWPRSEDGFNFLLMAKNYFMLENYNLVYYKVEDFANKHKI